MAIISVTGIAPFIFGCSRSSGNPVTAQIREMEYPGNSGSERYSAALELGNMLKAGNLNHEDRRQAEQALRRGLGSTSLFVRNAASNAFHDIIIAGANMAVRTEAYRMTELLVYALDPSNSEVYAVALMTVRGILETHAHRPETRVEGIQMRLTQALRHHGESE